MRVQRLRRKEEALGELQPTAAAVVAAAEVSIVEMVRDLPARSTSSLCCGERGDGYGWWSKSPLKVRDGRRSHFTYLV